MKVYLCDHCKKPKELTLWKASQKQVIKQALAESDGRISTAAILLGISLPTARRYAKMYGLWTTKKL